MKFLLIAIPLFMEWKNILSQWWKEKNKAVKASKQSGRPAEMFWVSHCGIILMLSLVAH